MSQGQMVLLRWLLPAAIGGVAIIVLAVTPLSAHTARDGFWPFFSATDRPAKILEITLPSGAAGVVSGQGKTYWPAAGIPVSGPSPHGDDTVGAPDTGSLPKNNTVAKGLAGSATRDQGARATRDLPPGIRDIPDMAGDLPGVIRHMFGAPAGSYIGLEQERKFIKEGWPSSPEKTGQNRNIAANEAATELCAGGNCPDSTAPKGAQGVTGSTTGTSGT